MCVLLNKERRSHTFPCDWLNVHEACLWSLLQASAKHTKVAGASEALCHVEITY